jgi:GT2 family glycosyltransferase
MIDKITKPELSIIIVNYNSGEYLNRCLNSIKQNIKKIEYEIIVVDNDSTDNSLDGIEKHEKLNIIKEKENHGFAKANNIGVSYAKGKYLLILNNDTIFFDNSIEKLMEYKKEKPEIGIISPVILYEDNSFQLSFGYDINLFSEILLKFFAEKYYKIIYKIKKNNFMITPDWISGACFLVEKKVYESVSGFDERFFLYTEDADFGKRVREKGFKLLVYGRAKIIHFKGKTSSKNLSIAIAESKKSQLYYYCKHNGKLSFLILKLYLKLKFKLKYYFDKRNRDIIEKVLEIVDEYRC